MTAPSVSLARGKRVSRVAGSKRLLRLAAALVLLCGGTALSASAQDVTYRAGADTVATKAFEIQACGVIGGTLVSDATAPVHAAAVAAIRAEKPTGDYFAYLGGSTTRSVGCPAPGSGQHSMACVWTWETPPYDTQNLAFYQGNFRPGSPVLGAGLEGSQALNNAPNYFGRFNGQQFYPSNLLGNHLLLFSMANAQMADSWADNRDAGGFQYLDAAHNYGKDSFFATCRIVSQQSSSASSVETSSSTLSSLRSGADSSTSTSSGAEVPTFPQPPLPTGPVGPTWLVSTPGNQQPAEEKRGLGVGSWIGISVAIALVIVVVVLLCCCGTRIRNCCCPERNLVMEDDAVGAAEDDEDRSDTASKRSFAVPNGSFRDFVPGEVTNASAWRLRRSLSDAHITTTTPNDIREGHDTTNDTLPQSAGVFAAAPGPIPAWNNNNYVNGAVVPAYGNGGRQLTRTSSNLNSNSRSSVGSDDSGRSFRQSRSVSFLEH